MSDSELMEPCVCYDTILSSIAILLLLIYFGVVLLQARHLSCRSMFAHLRKLWPTASAKGYDRVPAHVRKEVMNRTVRDSREYVRILPHTLAIAVMLKVANRLYGWSKLQTEVQDAVVLVGFIASIITFWRPSIINSTTSFVHSHFNLALCAAYGATATSQNLLLMTSAISLFYRLGIGFIHKDVAGIMFWNCVSIALSCYSFYSDGPHGEPSPISMRAFILCQVMASSVITVIVYIAYRVNFRSVLMELDGAASKNANTALRSLLDMLCDVTLELDNNLFITTECRPLSALLVQNHSSSLKGRKLEEFLASPDDRDRFAAHLSYITTELYSDSTPQVAALHFTMRDGVGNLFGAEMFSTSFLTIGGELRHLLGIREHVEAPVSALSSPRTNTPIRIRRQLAGNGTPRLAEREELGALHLNDPTASVVVLDAAPVVLNRLDKKKGVVVKPKKSQQKHALAAPNFAPTTDEAIAAAMHRLISHVNWQVERRVCCRRHAYLNQANKHFKTLYQNGCCNDFGAPVNFCRQCGQCGMLYDVDEIVAAGDAWKCYVCEPLGGDRSIWFRTQSL